MARLLIATTNPAKLSEYRILLRELGLDLELISLADAGIHEHPEETGATFADNAMLKARCYFQLAKIPTIADDGGLEVDALGGEPGVRSHRWLGPGRDNTDRALAEEVIARMRGVPPERRTARLCAAVALIYGHDGIVREQMAEAAMEGVIAERIHSEMRPGFPYRAVLYLPDRKCYVGELGETEEARISQRRTAVMMLADDFRRIAGAA
ncbi:MAG TPA: non-canonical purine NTP pyrophosphatase [Candidatus Binataceae bacterium]|nr:non-canonical purine NTP pyrophosphatase [Candidatus Binataceae bacterium]